MKKIITLLLLAVVLIGCVGSKRTTVNVSVENDGKPVVGVLVYMYETTINDYSYSHTYMAESATPTESNGIASIPLDRFEFIGNAGQVSFRFVTYDADHNINGDVAASIKYGETKDITIKQKNNSK